MLEFFVIFAKGFVIGISLAVVVGPIAILCIQQTLTHGFSAGIACGLGVATADGIYGALAGLGLSFINELLQAHHYWLRLGGGILLCYIGYMTFKRTILASPIPPTTTRLLNMYFSTCALTLSNPMTLIPLSALLASLELATTIERSMLIFLLFMGFFCGSLLWWIVLTTVVTFFRSYISTTTLITINKIAGTLITLFGVGVLISLYAWY